MNNPEDFASNTRNEDKSNLKSIEGVLNDLIEARKKAM
jgi:hypothetical protein